MDTPAGWWQITVEVPEVDADDASALVVDAGALGVQIVTHALETPRFADTPAPVLEPPPVGIARLICSYPANANAAHWCRHTATVLQQLGLDVDPTACAAERRTDSDWSTRWQAYFEPLALGRRIWVVPSWRHGAAPDDALVIEIDPGMAFGTGQHATTALCAAALERAIDSHPAAERAHLALLDVGCGSGILSILAAELGVQRVVAIDNQPMAVRACNENVQHNGVADRVHVGGERLETVTGSFDLVAANILAPVLIELAPQIMAHLAAGGRLLLSGLLSEQEDEVVAAYQSAAAALQRPALRRGERKEQDDWLALWLDAPAAAAREAPLMQQ